MNTLTKITTASLVALGIAGAGVAVAQTATETDPAATITMNEALAIAQEAQAGTVEEIERDREDGAVVYEVDIATADGDVEVIIDAATGEVLSVEQEDDNWGFFGGKDNKSKG
ncbi:MAG: PepSY domain-containing protein [Pseudomonadota bacterium]